jgi:AraC family transcriptional regulator
MVEGVAMRSETEQAYKERLLRVLVYIQQHLDEAIELNELARVAHFSPYHFHRLFRGMVGESVMEHVRRLRLERAAHRLKLTDQPVTRIAYDAGYETHEAFTRAFRAMFDESPSEFRREHQAVPVRGIPSGIHFATDRNLIRLALARNTQPQDVRIERLPLLRVAFVRHVGPYNEVGTAWSRLMSWAGERGLLAAHPRVLGIVHDDPEITPPDKIRYDACVAVGDQVQPDGDIGIQEVAGGDYAVATHRGPYHTLGDTYARLCGGWVPTSGHEMRSAPSFEIYLNAPDRVPPAELLTEIYVPLEGQQS